MSDFRRRRQEPRGGVAPTRSRSLLVRTIPRAAPGFELSLEYDRLIREKETKPIMKPQADRLYLTTAEVAAQLRVGPRTVRWLIRTQQLRAHLVGEEFLIEGSDLATFIEAHTVAANPEWKSPETE